jgi:uncharacterized protein YigE (DUF2233 family)
MSLFLTYTLSLLLFLSGSDYVTYTASPEKIKFYYQHNGKPVKTLANVPKIDKDVKFVTNAQINQIGYSAIGLYIENDKRMSKALSSMTLQ